MIAVISHGYRFREPFCLIVNASRPDRVHIAPVVFLLRMLERIAVHFGCRSENERGVFVLGQTERVMRTERSDFECWDWKLQIIDGTRRRCEVKYVVDLWFRKEDKVRDVVF